MKLDSRDNKRAIQTVCPNTVEREERHMIVVYVVDKVSNHVFYKKFHFGIETHDKNSLKIWKTHRTILKWMSYPTVRI